MGPDLIQDELAAWYPSATVIRDVLYVVDGRIATSAGIASGIDLAPHLIAVRDGPVVGLGATVEAAARTVGFADARMLRRLRSRETSACVRPRSRSS